MSRTTSHRPFKHTAYGSAYTELKERVQAGEITRLQMHQALTVIPFETRYFARAKPVGEYARSFNRSERYAAKRKVAREEELAPKYSPRGSAYWAQ